MISRCRSNGEDEKKENAAGDGNRGVVIFETSVDGYACKPCQGSTPKEWSSAMIATADSFSHV